jgi:MFS family permease
VTTPHSSSSDAVPDGPRRLPRNVWIVTVTSFLTDVSSEMVSNLLPLFLFDVLGAKTSAIGVIEGMAESTASLLKVFSGWLSDRMGSRKGLAVLGYAISTAAKPFLYLASSWPWVLGVRVADRIGKGVRTAPRDALVADSVSEKQRGLAFGIHRAGDTAGAVIGIGIALILLLATQHGAAALSRSTFQLIVLISVVPALLAVLVLAFGAREVRAPKQASAAVRLTLTGFDTRFRLFLVIVVIFTLGNSSDAFLILRAQNVGLSVPGVLGMMMTFNLIYALGSGPAGALSDRVGRKRLLIGGWLLYGVVYLGFARAVAGWQAWAWMGVYGLYYALTDGVARAFVADMVPAERRGTAYGVYNAAIGLTAFPASLIAGLLWQGFGGWPGLGPAAPFVFASALAIISTVLLLLLPGGGSRMTEAN